MSKLVLCRKCKHNKHSPKKVLCQECQAFRLAVKHRVGSGDRQALLLLSHLALSAPLAIREPILPEMSPAD